MIRHDLANQLEIHLKVLAGLRLGSASAAAALAWVLEMEIHVARKAILDGHVGIGADHVIPLVGAYREGPRFPGESSASWGFLLDGTQLPVARTSTDLTSAFVLYLAHPSAYVPRRTKATANLPGPCRDAVGRRSTGSLPQGGRPPRGDAPRLARAHVPALGLPSRVDPAP